MSELADFPADVIKRAMDALASTLPNNLHDRLSELASSDSLLTPGAITKAVAIEAARENTSVD
jgi:hypothetical protein